MQYRECPEYEQKHSEAAEQPEEQYLVGDYVAKPVAKTFLIFFSLGVEEAGIHFFGFVFVRSAHERRHTGTHANPFFAEVVGVIQVT